MESHLPALVGPTEKLLRCECTGQSSNALTCTSDPDTGLSISSDDREVYIYREARPTVTSVFYPKLLPGARVLCRCSEPVIDLRQR